MRIVPIPCLKDNYAYLVVCETTNTAAIVDPSEVEPVLEAVARERVTLTAIWNTHHHWDHTGGNKGLLAAHPQLAVIGHSSDKGRVPGQTEFVEDGDTVELGSEVSARIIFNPGHTSGAISFYLAAHKAVFTGDTLFLSGCGRMFEGTPPQMQGSLRRLRDLPEDTKVYCGHEYTAANLRFAAAVEPDNAAIAARAAEVAATRERGAPTVPGTIADERATNPFLRTDEAAVIAAVRAKDAAVGATEADIFGALRGWKDSF